MKITVYRDDMITFGGVNQSSYMILARKESTLPFMTEIVETATSMPGVPGSVQLDWRYAPKAFILVILNSVPYTPEQKKTVKSQINDLWVAGAEREHEIIFVPEGRTYNVKSVGVPEKINESAFYIKYALPFVAHDPYGYSGPKDLEFKAYNVGDIINNRGNDWTPARIEFTGPCTNPSVTINGTVYAYNGTVQNGSTLRVDRNGFTVDLYNPETGAATSANNVGWNGNFLEIPATTKLKIDDIQNAAGKHTVYWRDRYA